MIVPDTHLKKDFARSRWLTKVLLVALLIAVGWSAWVYGQIRYYADRDEAQPADAIAVFGAAEYDGRPSPVLRARLDHALELYQRRLAPLVITLGGGDPGDTHSEGGVGHDYLLAHGVPEAAI
ncbi:MAG: YdcF family protein, partial [Acidobacterium ailaaui]|nr:YdcF family protein [Pseudacidobacterium ailaaui]